MVFGFMKMEKQPQQVSIEKSMEKVYKEKATINGIDISVYYDENCQDFVLYMFHMTTGEEFKKSGPYEEIFHVANSEDDAKKVFQKAVELANLEKSPDELHSEVETYVKSLEK
jgi:hypothetical protein